MPLPPARHGGLRPGREGQRAAGPAAPLLPGAQVARRGEGRGPAPELGCGRGSGDSSLCPPLQCLPGHLLGGRAGMCRVWGVLCGAGRLMPRLGLLGWGEPAPHSGTTESSLASTCVRPALDAQARGCLIPRRHPLPRVRPWGDISPKPPVTGPGCGPMAGQGRAHGSQSPLCPQPRDCRAGTEKGQMALHYSSRGKEEVAATHTRDEFAGGTSSRAVGSQCGALLSLFP